MKSKLFTFFWDIVRINTQKIRSNYWSIIFPNKPKNLRVLGKIYVERPYNVYLGKSVSLNHGCYLNARCNIYIGDACHLSPFVMINAGQLDLNNSERLHISKEVKIGNRVWIATNAIINPGVTIGDDCVIGAGAVVTRNLPPNTLCVGVPAKPIKKLS